MSGSGVPHRANTLARLTHRGVAVSIDEDAVLQFLNYEETPALQALLDDDGKMIDLINGLDAVKQLKVDKDTLMTSNKSLAEFNLTKKIPLATGKEELNKLYGVLKGLKQEVDALQAQHDSKSTVLSLDTTHALLQTKAAQTEEESEAIADNFLSGKCEVDSFVEQYLAKKTKAHLQRIKAEKMGEMIHQQHASGAQSQASQHHYNPPPGSMYSSQAPYSYSTDPLPSVSM